MIHRARLILTRIWRWRGRTHAIEMVRRGIFKVFLSNILFLYIWVICVSSLRVCSKQEDGSVDVGEVADLNQLDHLQDFDQLVLREGCRKKTRIFYGLLPNPPWDPPPTPGMVFLRIKKLPLFFLSEMRSQIGETNFTFCPIPKFYFFVL